MSEAADGETVPFAWKSQLGVKRSTDGRVITATAKGWGRSGALSDGLITRTGEVEGFLAVLPQVSTSLYIGFSNLSTTLYESSRAHQEDLEFAIKVTVDGTISYQTRERMQEMYHAALTESDVIGSVEQGDAIGMRLTPDRRGFSIILLDKVGRSSAAAAAAQGSSTASGGAGMGALACVQRQHLTVLKTFSEVLTFPMKVLVVFGTSGTQIGPMAWLRGKAAKSEVNMKGMADGSAAAGSETAGERVVVGKHAGDMLGAGALDGKGGMLVLQVPAPSPPSRSRPPPATRPPSLPLPAIPLTCTPTCPFPPPPSYPLLTPSPLCPARAYVATGGLRWLVGSGHGAESRRQETPERRAAVRRAERCDG